MSETGIETQPVDGWAVISLTAAVLTLLSLCGGIAPVPFTGFVCFPAAGILGVLAAASGLRSLRRIRRSGESGRTFAVIGIVTGSLVVLATICLVVLGIRLYPSLLDLLHRLRF